MSGFEHRNSVIEILELFGYWCLEFGYCKGEVL
jgi:hypothetical protein